MFPFKHSFLFQHIQNGQLILPIPNGNGQNGHYNRKPTNYKLSHLRIKINTFLFGFRRLAPQRSLNKFPLLIKLREFEARHHRDTFEKAKIIKNPSN